MTRDRKGWRRVKFGEMAEQVNERVDDPKKAGASVYVGLEHLDSDSLKIRRWGSPDDVEATKLRFYKGDIIFGRRRAYQRKLGVAEFDGICSAHAMVLRARPEVVAPEFLPFFMQSDVFMKRAQEISVGSLSPTINWTTLREQEFDLPPTAAQLALSASCELAATVAGACLDAMDAVAEVYRAFAEAELVGQTSGGIEPRCWNHASWNVRLLDELTLPEAPITYGIVQPGNVVSGGPLVVTSEDIQGDFRTDIMRVHPDIERQYVRSRVQPGDILVVVKGFGSGKIGVVPEHFSGNINRDVARIRCSDQIEPRFFYHLWRSDSYSRYRAACMVGTTRPEMSIGTLRRLQVPYPGIAEQRRIAAVLDLVETRRDALKARVIAARRVSRALMNPSGAS